MSLQQYSGEESSLCRIHEFSHCSFSHSLTFNEATSELYSGGVGKHTNIIVLFQGLSTIQFMIVCK